MCMPSEGKAPSSSTSPKSNASFLGNVIEICIVTRDHQQKISGLLELGIGPWKSYTFTPENTTSQTYRGQPSSFTLKVSFAEVNNMVWEIISPLSGPTIFDEFLEEHGEGVHHVAHDCNGIPWAERIEGFEKRGFKMVQSGEWMGRNKFAFFETDGKIGTCFETIYFPDDWVFPQADEEYDLPASKVSSM